MSKQRIWTEEKRELLLKLMSEDKSYSEIAEALGFTRESVKSYVYKFKLNDPNKKFKWTEEKYEILRQMRAEGKTYTEMCEVLGCASVTIHDTLLKMGLINRRNNKEQYKGCDEDCYNCPYSDCLKPENLC